MPNLPKNISYVPSVINHGNNIILCGGQNNENSCLRLDNQEWFHFNNLTQERTESSAIAIKGQSSFIFGGKKNKLTSESLSLGHNKWQKQLKNIPKGSYGSCVVKITDQELLIIGGPDSPDRIMKYNLTSQNPWKELEAKLYQGRHNHACYVFNGKVIITGGRDDGESMQSTEILDLANLKLRKGGNMNESRYRHGMGIITECCSFDLEAQVQILTRVQSFFFLESSPFSNCSMS